MGLISHCGCVYLVENSQIKQGWRWLCNTFVFSSMAIVLNTCLGTVLRSDRIIDQTTNANFRIRWLSPFNVIFLVY